MKLSRLAAVLALAAFLFLYLTIGDSSARALYDAPQIGPGVRKPTQTGPYVDVGVHNVGKIGLTVVNAGHFGTGFLAALPGEAPSCDYPYPGQQDYLFAGSFWIGAVVGRDTLVSVGADGWFFTREMWPDPGDLPPPAGGAIVRRSISNPEDNEAISEQDFIAVYTDTVTNTGLTGTDPRDGRAHQPLNIEVSQRSYAWSYAYAEDFVLFDYSIKNIGRRTLEKVYMGIYVDGDVRTKGSQEGFDDDICGFKDTSVSMFGCGFVDTANIAWIADNDGRQSENNPCPFTSTSLTALTGSRVVRTPSDSLKYSFNWWISNGTPSLDFGPRKAGTQEDPFRDFGGFLGTPEGDKNKYYIMRHEEFDYDQLFCAKDNTADGWLTRPALGSDFANGYDTRYLFSFGPFNIDPGEVLPISFAYIAAENFHTDCNAFRQLFDPYDPQAYYDYLDFEDLSKNSVWASWIYDNPGYDTDEDGYKGKYWVCGYDSQFIIDTIITDSGTAKWSIYNDTIIDSSWVYTVADTFWYEGDGVPDFRGASPPPAPSLWVVDTSGDTLRSRVLPYVTEFDQGELRVRWNGFRSETEKDVFSNKVDFEGYRVWYSYTPSATGFSIMASYDIEDFTRYTWNPGRGLWEIKDTPFGIDSLKALYGEGFDPLIHDRDHPFYYYDIDADTTFVYYFITQDWNQSNLRDTMAIHKIWPDEPPPSTTDLDSARIHYPEQLTDDGLFFKHYEYEFVIRNLLPSQLHYVAVTAFDYGSPSSGLESLETPPQKNYIAEYPQHSAADIEQEGLNVIVYPNPYRSDGQYREFGFEGRDYIDNDGNLVFQEGFPPDRTRSIHFINLPHKCTIRIFSIDGDLVRKIDHDVPEGYPQSSHERWDLITRNTQAVVSGIYYYSVESDLGNQIGKLVIIM
ncbi:MAG: hypothetical protein JSU69_11540 [Candidatus Zixiibacteriota bacterium]|nr:MAG: hypothetical protein JSU69_11540 [candidate division Zixibacteria bacterium]